MSLRPPVAPPRPETRHRLVTRARPVGPAPRPAPVQVAPLPPVTRASRTPQALSAALPPTAHRTGEPGRERFGFVGGMRTFAAVQVFLLHYGAAFLPAAVGVAGSAHYA